jgi:hypothetical protein
MKKQVLATIIGTMAVITSVTAHADNWVSPSSYGIVKAPPPVICTLTELNPAGGDPISKQTLGSPYIPSNQTVTLEFKRKDSQVIATAALRDGGTSVSVITNILGDEQFRGWVQVGQSTYPIQPYANMTLDCNIKYGTYQSDYGYRAFMNQGGENAQSWHGGANGGQQWTVGSTSLPYNDIKVAHYEITSKAFGEDRVIDFGSGIVVGFQVNSGWGKDSRTNGSWTEENYTNRRGGVGTSTLKLRFSNQPFHGMKYSVTVFYF